MLAAHAFFLFRGDFSNFAGMFQGHLFGHFAGRRCPCRPWQRRGAL